MPQTAGMATLGSVLRDYREKAGHSREYVGEHVGRGADSVARWETDKSRPPRSVLVKLAALLGVPLEDLDGE